MASEAIEVTAGITQHFGDPALVAQLREQMLKYAALKISDPIHAEDLVQEALLGAARNLDKFNGKAAFKSWVFAILKNKLSDHFREQAKAPDLLALETDPLEDDFNERGHWQQASRPYAWSCPEQGLHEQQFLLVLEACVNFLPAMQAQVFMLREITGNSVDAIAEELGVSANNVNVLLYRARAGLQKCIGSKWGSGGAL